MRLFGSERIAKIMERMGLKEGEVIQHPMIRAPLSVRRRRSKKTNYGIRKRLWSTTTS